MPGVVLLKLRPDALAEYSAKLTRGVVLCSATNGKTTTTHLIVAAAKAAGLRVVTNTEGSNLERGIAAAFLSGDRRAEIGIFEVDEAALPAVAASTAPSVIVLMNLFRDQLDRYGELETLVDRWSDTLDTTSRQPSPPVLVLNADDPNIAEIGRDRTDVLWFGVNDTLHALDVRAHAADATSCRRCGSPLEHDVVLLGHLGHWHCTSCDAARPTPDIAATTVVLTAEGGQVVDITLPDGKQMHVESTLPGLHNAYNMTAAAGTSLAVADRIGRGAEVLRTAAALSSTTAVFGRGESIPVGDRAVRILLAKNPTGVNQNVRTLMAEPHQAHVLVLLNDRTADGQDVSWIWDVDWEPLEAHLSSLTLGGDRAGDLALRFLYGGFDMAKVAVRDKISDALDAALDRTEPGATLHALPTYTAMLDLRGVLTDRGYAADFWEAP